GGVVPVLGASRTLPGGLRLARGGFGRRRRRAWARPRLGPQLARVPVLALRRLRTRAADCRASTCSHARSRPAARHRPGATEPRHGLVLLRGVGACRGTPGGGRAAWPRSWLPAAACRGTGIPR